MLGTERPPIPNDPTEKPLGAYLIIARIFGYRAHAFLGYTWLFLAGAWWQLVYECLWVWDKLMGKTVPRKPCGGRLIPSWNEFFQGYMYGVICDCWNRPVCSSPGSWIDVVDRVSQGSGNDERLVPVSLNGDSCIHSLNLASYNYLGFGGVHPVITPAVIESVWTSGVSIGSTPSELGICQEQAEAEQAVAKFLGVEAAAIIPMGFATNGAGVSALVGENCLILSDALNHASIITGVRLSGAKVRVFKHNDMKDLELQLKRAVETGNAGKPWKKILVVVEGMYSMEGELCDLPALVALKNKYGAFLYVDEAHSIGAVGPNGRGVCDLFSIDPKSVDVLMGTFTKSFASIGGYVAGSTDVVNLVRNISFAYLFGASMSPPCARQILESLRLLQTPEGAARVAQLARNSHHLYSGLKKAGFTMVGPDNSPVVPMLIGHPKTTATFSRQCLKKNIAVVVVGYPATPVLQTRARFCVSAAHTDDELDRAVAIMTDIGKKLHIDFGTKEKRDEHYAVKSEEIDFSEMNLREPLAHGSPLPQTVFQANKNMLVLDGYDYLGLANSQAVKAACVTTIEKYGVGTCGPRGFYGTTTEHLVLENDIANWLHVEGSILYSYAVSVPASVIPTFANPKGTLLYDSACNDSIRLGIMLSHSARTRSFPHNDVVELERELERETELGTESILIVVEGLYRDTGDIAPLHKIVALKDKFSRVRLLVDESLSLGALGKTGRGATEYWGLSPTTVDYLIGSLDTFIGAAGGFCAGTFRSCEDQTLASRAYCFSASAPSFLCTAARVVLRQISNPSDPDGVVIQDRIDKLHFNAQVFTSAMQKSSFELYGAAGSPIIHLKLSRHMLTTPPPSTGIPIFCKECGAAGAHQWEVNTLRAACDMCMKKGNISVHVASCGFRNAPHMTRPSKDVNDKSSETCRGRPSIRVCVSSKHNEDELREAAALLSASLLEVMSGKI